MVNYEYFKDEIEKVNKNSGLRNGEYGFGVLKGTGKPVSCNELSCDKCIFDDEELNFEYGCYGARVKWLFAEHIEKPKLTKKERQFCELVETGWIARDENGILYYSTNKPIKIEIGGRWLGGMTYINIYDRFPAILGNSFSFITWDDKEPWSVEELLKLEVMEG